MAALIRKDVTETKITKTIQEIAVSLQEVLEEYHCGECPLEEFCDKAIEAGIGSACGELNINQL